MPTLLRLGIRADLQFPRFSRILAECDFESQQFLATSHQDRDHLTGHVILQTLREFIRRHAKFPNCQNFIVHIQAGRNCRSAARNFRYQQPPGFDFGLRTQPRFLRAFPQRFETQSEEIQRFRIVQFFRTFHCMTEKLFEGHACNFFGCCLELFRSEAEAAAHVVNHPPDDDEDADPESADHLAGVVREMMKRARQPNLSFFAFTATPKYKTLKVFDEAGPTGQAPFHLYTMRQAIEEKFILDVLKNYVTYEAYFRLVQVGDDDPHVQRKKAARSLARTLTFHAVNLRTKTEVMVEHFRTHVRHKIGGRAKAMVVTDGRLHAVCYKQAFDGYIAERGYTDVKTLVAFSGIVEDPDAPGKSYTEVGMNGGIKESELPERFDSHEY
jgi:hypothetical protein